MKIQNFEIFLETLKLGNDGKRKHESTKVKIKL